MLRAQLERGAQAERSDDSSEYSYYDEEEASSSSYYDTEESSDGETDQRNPTNSQVAPEGSGVDLEA